MRRDGSKALDREEFKHALQIWGMEEESLNEVRTTLSRPQLASLRRALGRELPRSVETVALSPACATAPGRAAESQN